MTLFAELNCTKIFSKISRKFEKMFRVSLIIGDDFSLTQIIQPIVTARGRCEKLTLGQTAKKKIVEMFQVKSFLGCCQLETGGIILGWFFFCTFLLATTIVFVYGSMLIVAGRKFWSSCAEIWHKFVKRFAFSSSTLYADLAWCHYFLDYCHLCVVVNDSRNQNCELRHYIESIRKNPTVSSSRKTPAKFNRSGSSSLQRSFCVSLTWFTLYARSTSKSLGQKMNEKYLISSNKISRLWELLLIYLCLDHRFTFSFSWIHCIRVLKNFGIVIMSLQSFESSNCFS